MNWRKKTLRLLWIGLGVLVLSAFAFGPGQPVRGAEKARGPSRFVRIPSADAGKLSGLGIHPRKAFDYGAFQWLELNAADVDRMQKEGLRFELQSVSYELTLGEQRFDPLKSPPRFEQGWGPTAHSGKDLQLVQFFAPIQQDWLEMLQAQGLEVVQYIYPFTYVVWGDADALSSVTREQVVRWAGPFAPAYRVLPAWRALGKETVNVHVLIYRGADVGQLVAQIEALGGKSTGRRVLNDTWEMVGFALAGDQIRAAARLPGVYSIQPVHTDGGPRGEMSDQINAGNYDASNQAFPGYLDWLDSVGVHGTGVIIANVDGGVQDNHPDLVNRLIPCTGVTCGGSATDGHGTHTAGIMAADGSSGVTDQYGFLRGLGMAPGANLVEQVYFPWYTQPGGMLLLMTDSYNNGASLSGNSWGPSGTPKGYDDDTLQVDIGVRDADPEAPGNQPLTYVLSFMNGYGGTSSQGTPDEAKNIFTIGSTKMQNSNGSQILDINDLSSNTAHGPALDGRTIPHMVAPGCNVDSTYSGSSYSLLCGTSMASPHVSGAVALFIEYYRNLTAQSTGRLADPSPALVKAAFLPVAHDLAGFDDADGFPLGHPFDSKQGWGRMDTDAVVNPQVAVEYFDNPMVFDNTGEEWVQTLAPADPTQPVRMMLVWTDAPGHGLGGSTPAWNNNLDLIVEADGNTYHGNDFGPDGWSQAGGSADFMNNTEGVFLGPIPPGSFTIRVVASDINSDGVPNQGDTTDQDFALVCYNCGPSAADFTLSASPAQQTVCTPEDALYDVSVGSVLGYNDAVTLSVLGVPAGASSSFSVNGQTAPFDSVLTIGNTGAAAAGSYEMDIVGIAPTSTHTTTVNLTLFTAVPGIPTPLSPADGASGVPLVPEFTWSPAADATSYLLEVAEDPGFTNVVYSAVVEETSHLMDGALAPVTSYYWRVRASNICGEGENSATFSFTTADVPPILLVDDDDNSPDVQSSYTAALDGLGLAYDIWDTGNSDNEPSAAELSPYDVVIWFTGDEYGGSAGPGSAGEAALAAWLDNGGCFFISSQDYHWDRGLTNFMSTYLGTAAVTDDSGNYSAVSGSGSLYGGLGPYPLSYPFSDYSDILNPDGTAELAFLGDNSNPAGVNKNAGGYQTTFLGFPLEAMTLGDRQEVLNTFLNACGAAQNLLRVSRIQLKLLQGGNAVGTRIFVVDGSDLPVEGAAVTFEWTLPDGTKVPRTRVTNPLGRVQNRAPDAGPGWYIVKVVDVTKAGYTWTGGDVIKRRIFRP